MCADTGGFGQIASVLVFRMQMANGKIGQRQTSSGVWESLYVRVCECACTRALELWGVVRRLGTKPPGRLQL